MGGVGHFSNERGFSVEIRLQRISLKFVVETKRFVDSFVHVILTRQTCGQSSSRAAESKRQTTGNHFSERICYRFLKSKYWGDWDLGLCTTAGHAFGEPLRSGDFWGGKRCFDAGKTIFCHCAAVLQSQVPKLCTDLGLSLLYKFRCDALHWIPQYPTISRIGKFNQFLSRRGHWLTSRPNFLSY